MQSPAAVLFAVPVEREEFGCHPYSADSSDYVRLLAGNEADIERAWERRYSRVAEAAQELVRTCLDCGVSVVQRAGVADLREATAKFSVVVLVAHWKGAEVTHPDVLVDVSSIGKALGESANRHVRAIADRIRAACKEDADASDACVDSLNEFIEHPKLYDFEAEAMSAAGAIDVLTLQCHRRLLIDRTLRSLLVAGNRMELCGEMYSREDIEAAIDPAFAGVLDLSTCDSSVPGQHIKQVRGGRLLVAFGTEKLLPAARFHILATTFKAMIETGGDYPTARLAIERALAGVFRVPG